MADVQLLTSDDRALAWFAGWWSYINGGLWIMSALVAHLIVLVALEASAPPPAVVLIGGLAAGSVTVAAGVLHLGTPGRFLRRGR